VQVPEYGIQAALVLAMLLSRKWVVLCIELPVLAYHVRTFALNDYKTDVTEIFRQLPRERRKRIIKLAIYMGGFVFIVYKCDSAGLPGPPPCWYPHMQRTAVVVCDLVFFARGLPEALLLPLRNPCLALALIHHSIPGPCCAFLASLPCNAGWSRRLCTVL
jgi:hypothetical protein